MLIHSHFESFWSRMAATVPPSTVTMQTILWDLDGTLANWQSLAIIPRTALEYLGHRPAGLPWLATALVATKAYLRVLRNTSQVPNNRLYNRLVARALGLTPAESHAWTCRLLDDPVFADCVRRSIQPIPEARRLVEELARRGDRRQIVATNPVMPIAFNRLRLGIAGYDPGCFTYISGSEDFIGQKKTPAFYQRLMHLCGLKPEDCLMIGNDPRKDLLARQAGIRVFFLTTPYTVVAPIPEGCEPDWQGGYPELAGVLGLGH